jgi:hypothetical protein
MARTRTTEPATLSASAIAGAITGVGVVTMALFPFAIPILLLTAAFTAPLVLAVALAALPVAIVAGVARAMRAIGRRRSSVASLPGDRVVDEGRGADLGRLSPRSPGMT